MRILARWPHTQPYVGSRAGAGASRRGVSPRIHAVAAHEAAHVVVGCAVGLRLDLASIGRRFDKALACDIEGGAWFRGTPRRHREA